MVPGKQTKGLKCFGYLVESSLPSPLCPRQSPAPWLLPFEPPSPPVRFPPFLPYPLLSTASPSLISPSFFFFFSSSSAFPLDLGIATHTARYTFPLTRPLTWWPLLPPALLVLLLLLLLSRRRRDRPSPIPRAIGARRRLTNARRARLLGAEGPETISRHVAGGGGGVGLAEAKGSRGHGGRYGAIELLDLSVRHGLPLWAEEAPYPHEDAPEPHFGGGSNREEENGRGRWVGWFVVEKFLLRHCKVSQPIQLAQA